MLPWTAGASPLDQMTHDLRERDCQTSPHLGPRVRNPRSADGSRKDVTRIRDPNPPACRIQTAAAHPGVTVRFFANPCNVETSLGHPYATRTTWGWCSASRDLRFASRQWSLPNARRMGAQQRTSWLFHAGAVIPKSGRPRCLAGPLAAPPCVMGAMTKSGLRVVRRFH